MSFQWQRQKYKRARRNTQSLLWVGLNGHVVYSTISSGQSQSLEYLQSQESGKFTPPRDRLWQWHECDRGEELGPVTQFTIIFHIHIHSICKIYSSHNFIESWHWGQTPRFHRLYLVQMWLFFIQKSMNKLSALYMPDIQWWKQGHGDHNNYSHEERERRIHIALAYRNFQSYWTRVVTSSCHW